MLSYLGYLTRTLCSQKSSDNNPMAYKAGRRERRSVPYVILQNSVLNLINTNPTCCHDTKNALLCQDIKSEE